jgi:hypothetical protein
MLGKSDAGRRHAQFLKRFKLAAMIASLQRLASYG